MVKIGVVAHPLLHPLILHHSATLSKACKTPDTLAWILLKEDEWQDELMKEEELKFLVTNVSEYNFNFRSIIYQERLGD